MKQIILKVSVCMITYGHENYIQEAIKGVLMQEGDFEIELILANDCSPDATDAVIQEILKNHPNGSCINYINQEKNIGMMPNFIFALQQCKGKYVALCEGDDYWTDPLKLQRQVDFLEANEEYVLAFHQVAILNSNGKIVEDFITKVPENYEHIETLAQLGNYIHTPSVVFRNIINEFPIEYQLTTIGDFFLYMLIAEKGKLKHLEEKMAVYREGVGLWSSKSSYYRNLNTAFTHALLVSVFDRKENAQIVSILLKRIEDFLDRFTFQIMQDDLDKLSSNLLVSKIVSKWLFKENIELKGETVQKKTLVQLIKIIVIRLKKRIWKK